MVFSPSSLDATIDLLAAFWRSRVSISAQQRRRIAPLARLVELEFSERAQRLDLTSATVRLAVPEVLRELNARDPRAHHLIARIEQQERGEIPGRPRKREAMEPSDRIRIAAFAAAQASDDGRSAAEIHDIRHAIRIGEHRDRFELELYPAITVEDIQREIRKARPDFFHLASHGDSRTVQVATRPDRLFSTRIPLEALAEAARLTETIRCALLNSCSSGEEGQKLADCFGCDMIGMGAPIADGDARVFALTFYESIADGYSVEKAFHFGRTQLKIEQREGKDTPRLFRPTQLS